MAHRGFTKRYMLFLQTREPLVTPLYIPFIIMAALEATVYALYLGSNGLYIINEVATISLPRTLFEVKDGRISKVVSSLNIVKVSKHQVCLGYRSNHSNEQVLCAA